MATRMQQRRGTASQWTSANPVLAAGELGYETDTKKFKIGDGVATWTSLPYFVNVSDIIDSAPAALDTLNELAAALNDDENFATNITNIVSAKSGFLVKTQTQWNAYTDNIPSGTICVNSSSTNAIKIGVGDLPWSSLPYVVFSDSFATAISTLTSAVDDAAADATSALTLANDHETSKADTLSPTFTGTVTLPSSTSIGNVTAQEIEYIDGVTSNIQTQLDSKLSSTLASTTYATKDAPTITGNAVLPSTTTIGSVTGTEISYLSGTTSAIQTQLNAKAPISSPTFTGTVSGITKSMVGLGNVDNTSDASKPISTATQSALDLKAPLADPTFSGTVTLPSTTSIGNVSATELGYVDGVTSSIQTQLNAKANLSGATFTGDVTGTNLTLTGNLTVSGTTTTVSASNLEVADPLIYLSANQYDTDTVDIGIFGAYGDSNPGHFHTGLIRDASDGGKWKLVSAAAEPTSNVVDFTSVTYDTLKLGALEATSATIGNVSNTELQYLDGVTSAIQTQINAKAPTDSPTFTGTVTLPSSGITFTDGAQTKQGVPSITPIVQKTASYTLGALTERDSLIEIGSASATTITIPADSTLNFPVGTSLDILQTGAGQVTVAGAGGVTVNATPGLKLRTQWSSATLFKRAANTWVVYGDLTA